MAAAAAITLPDSQGTPVDHVFTPTSIKGDKAEYKNFAEENSIGREVLSMQLTENGRLRKVVSIIKVPRLITEVINGVNVPSVPDFGMVKIEHIVPLTWALEDVEDLVEIASQLYQQVPAIVMPTKGEFVF
jgi:hypothetical protein